MLETKKRHVLGHLAPMRAERPAGSETLPLNALTGAVALILTMTVFSLRGLLVFLPCFSVTF